MERLARVRPLLNPSVPEFVTFLNKLYDQEQLRGAGKIGQAFARLSKTRMTSSQYPKEWFDTDSGQILATNIDSDQRAIALENAGITFMKDISKRIGINSNQAALPRKLYETGYTVSDPGCIYYNPLIQGKTPEEFLSEYVSYYCSTKDGGLRVKGTDAFSLGTDAFSLGTDAYSLGKDLYTLGKASEVSEENKSSRSKKGGSVPKDAQKTSLEKAKIIKAWCDEQVREYPNCPNAVCRYWIEMTKKSLNGEYAKKVFACFKTLP